MSKIPNQITLTAEQANLLGELTSKTGKSPQEVVAEALRQYAPAASAGSDNGPPAESVYDALARAGLIGCIEGGPADVSTNPKYMEGFGKS